LAYTLADDVALFSGGTVIARGFAETVLAGGEAMAAAHLRPPLLLELGLKARAFGWLAAGDALPRQWQDMLDLIDAVGARGSARP
jgi:cobalt/nickel transport system ATP-binding protein